MVWDSDQDLTSLEVRAMLFSKSTLVKLESDRKEVSKPCISDCFVGLVLVVSDSILPNYRCSRLNMQKFIVRNVNRTLCI